MPARKYTVSPVGPARDQDVADYAADAPARYQDTRALQPNFVEFVEMRHPDICCGAAGLYSTLEPEMSKRILAEKLDDLMATNAELVVTGNPGCQMQLAAGLRSRGSQIRVEHLSELLATAY